MFIVKKQNIMSVFCQKKICVNAELCKNKKVQNKQLWLSNYTVIRYNYGFSNIFVKKK